MNLSDNVNRDSAQVCRFVNDVLYRGRRRLIPVGVKCRFRDVVIDVDLFVLVILLSCSPYLRCG